MSLLSKLFRKPVTPLQLGEFIANLSPGAILSAGRSGQGPEGRIATTISLLVLAQCGRFANGLQDSVSQLPGGGGSRSKSPVSYDTAVFEVAAFTYYWLLRPFLSSTADDVDGVAYDDDPYFAVLKESAHVTGAILKGHTTFGLSEQFFVHRASSYGLVPNRDLATEFESILSSSLEAGSPRGGRRGALSLDLALGLALKVSIPLYCGHMLPAIAEAAQSTFGNADELGMGE